MAESPSTSDERIFRYFEALDLPVRLTAEGSDDFETVFNQLIEWFADSARAEAARVVSFVNLDAAQWSRLRKPLCDWLGVAIPSTVDDEDLAGYAGDLGVIQRSHSGADAHPVLLCLESDSSALFMWRPAAGDTLEINWDGQLRYLSGGMGEGTEEGHFREDECSRAFTDHVKAGCDICTANLRRADEEHSLPEAFEHLRTWPVPERPRSILDDLPPLAPVSGVGIVIKRDEPPQPKRPWWKFGK